MPKFITVTANPAVDKGFVVSGFLPGEVHRAQSVRTTPGGKGVNAARVLTTLGADVVAIGFAGGGSGQVLRNGLDAEGIASEFVDVSPEETRLAILVIDTESRKQTVVNEPGPELGEEQLDALEKLLVQLIEPGGFVLLCGSLPPGLPQDAYARLITAGSNAEAKTLIDSSGRALRESFNASPTVVKINRKELRELGIPIQDWNRDGFAVVQEFRELSGAQIAVVTDGESGALVSAGHRGMFRASSPRLEVVSAVGSGDSFAAGLAFALAGEPDDLERAIRFAMACGGANALNEGAGYLSREQIDAVSGRIDTVRMA